MTNFAWANPSTGVRRQAATLEAARRELWEELQEHIKRNEIAPTTSVNAMIFEQERAGAVSKSSAIVEVEEWWPGGYAYASPVNGERYIVASWNTAADNLIRILREMVEPPHEVIVYRQKACVTVHSSDPEPAVPAPPAPPAPDTPASLIQAVQEGTCYDLNRAQILAMLWIAEALKELSAMRGARTHAFEFADGEICAVCGLPMSHAAHGYTGDKTEATAQ